MTIIGELSKCAHTLLALEHVGLGMLRSKNAVNNNRM